MKRIFLIGFIGLLALMMVACGGGDSNEIDETGTGNEGEGGEDQEQFILKFSHVASPKSIKGVAVDKFAELVSEKTDGRVEVEHYPSSQLYGDNDELDALISGNVQMIAPSVSKLVKLDPRWQFVDLPFLFKDTEHVHTFFQSDVAQKLMNSEQLVNNNILGLTFWENGFINFHNNEKPIVSPEDFEGLTIRTQAGQVIEAKFDALGAGSATVAWGETYSALQQGVADGAETTFNMMETASLHEVQDYLTVSQHGRVDYVVLVNNDFWNELPQDLQDQVSEALQEATEYEWSIAEEFNQESFEILEQSGELEITELSEEDRNKFIEVLQPVYDEFRETITPEIIDGIQNME